MREFDWWCRRWVSVLFEDGFRCSLMFKIAVGRSTESALCDENDGWNEAINRVMLIIISRDEKGEVLERKRSDNVE